jgi:cytochrome b involved in lipid metabolism
MNKKTIITIIVLILIAIIASSFSNKNKDVKVTATIEETSPRNDTVSEATTTEEVVVKSYSLAEVALHDKPEDCWLVIEDKVINPTQFIAEGKHPNDKILNGCGKDATSMFKNIPKHSGPTPQEALKMYEIGILR